MNDVRDLTVILQSRFSLVVIESPEEPRVLALLERVCALEHLPLFIWSVADGLKRDGKENHIVATQELVGCLRHIDATRQNGVYVMLDAHPFLEDPVTLRLIREIALGYEKTARTIVFVSNRMKLPPELTRLSATFQLSVLDYEQVRALFKEEIGQWQESHSKVRGDNIALDMLARQMVGLPPEDARRLIRQAIADDGLITMDDVKRVMKKKHDLHASSSVLSLELDVASGAQVGGQANLKRWLANRRTVFLGDPLGDKLGDGPDSKASAVAGLDIPKGVLLLGVQGSGKSLAAKSVAGTWGLPLLRLDFGTLYNKFYGETEKNLREALAAAESMAPAVLWIDEIEKGIATDSGGDMDGGVSRRVLGTLLTWMSERKSRVFLVATANDIEQLPPELLRKGRFDEIFFVDLPKDSVRWIIFELHLKRRKLDVKAFDLAALALATEGFSGAEIEQAIVSALYEAHARSVGLDTPILLEEIARTKPLSVVMGEKVEALREWARERTVPAD